jgi:DNA-binding response OmpR family regulator
MQNERSSRILVVSPNDEFRNLLVETLQHGGGYTVAAAATFDRALEEVTYAHFPLVLTEINLGSLSGIDLLVGLGKIDPATRVIIIDDDLMAKSIVAAFRLGAADYLYKPLDMDFVLLRVNRELERLQQQPDTATPDVLPEVNLNRDKWLNPASRPAALVLNKRHFDSIQEQLQQLMEHLGARFVGLIDSDHNIIGAAGELVQTDLLELRKAFSLNSRASQLASILREEQFSYTHYEGNVSSVFITDFGKLHPVSLIVICPADTKPGLVWLALKRTTTLLQQMLGVLDNMPHPADTLQH